MIIFHSLRKKNPIFQEANIHGEESQENQFLALQSESEDKSGHEAQSEDDIKKEHCHTHLENMAVFP